MKCRVKYTMLDNRLTWTCNKGLGTNLSENQTHCYRAGCFGRTSAKPSYDSIFEDIEGLVAFENARANNGKCGNFFCSENVIEGSRFCSDKHFEFSRRFQEEFSEMKKKLGRPIVWVKLNCHMCGESLKRKPWQVKQNKSGKFFCCRAHQELWSLRGSESRGKLSMEDAVNGKSKRD